MKEENSYSSQFEARKLLDLLVKYWKPVIIVIIASAVVSGYISFKVEEKYESSIVLFPASSISVSNSLLSKTYKENELLKFGEEEEVEQMLQVLKSNTVRDKIIDKFNLLEHYNIDTSSKYPQTNLYRRFNNNINIKRTEFMSVRVEVLDRNADTAARIANEFAQQLDAVMNNMQQDRAEKSFILVKNEYIDQRNKVGKLKDSLSEIQRKGVVEFESQSEVYSEQHAKALANNNIRGARRLQSKLDTLAKYGAAYTSLQNQIEEEIKKLSEIESKYIEAKVDLNQDLPHKYVVDNAVSAEKKSYPKRWLIILLSVLSTFLLSVIILIFIDKKKKE